jgi:protein-L-isoaspartate(D-aspartate) O-methyltransferase
MKTLHEMVEKMRLRGIRQTALLDAIEEIPRELFIPDFEKATAYEDSPAPIGYGQTISQPYVVALMIQELQLDKTHCVLDVGCGSGYQTALLSRLARHVYAIERIDDLTERAIATLAALNIDNISITTGDGSMGWPEEAPFDRIISGAAGPDIPQPWIDQLADNGRIVAPVGGGEMQKLVLVRKNGSVIRRDELMDVRFVRLIGREGFPE